MHRSFIEWPFAKDIKVGVMDALSFRGLLHLFKDGLLLFLLKPGQMLVIVITTTPL